MSKFMEMLANLMVDSKAFFILVMCVVIAALLAVGGLVFWTVIQCIERRW